MSGHSKWSSIKHKKAATDAKRGQLFTKLAREITMAAKQGDADPDMNAALRLAIQRARDNNMPNDNIGRALKRGTGGGDADRLEEIAYEGYGPGGTAIIVEAVTDNRNRTVAEVRLAFTRGGGSLAETGAVSWQFVRSAYFVVPTHSSDPDAVFEAAVEAGAEDVVLGEEDIEIVAPVETYKTISDALEALGAEVADASLRMIPSSVVSLPPEESLQVMRMMEHLEDLEDVQTVFSNLDVTEEAVALLELA